MSAGTVISRDTRFAIPAFADSSKLRLMLGTLLYLAQGFPQGIFFYAMPTWLAANGQSTEVVALAAAAASLPWSLKFIAGLFMDRDTWAAMGRRRPWLIGSQICIIISLIAISLISPLPEQVTLVISFVFMLSVLTAVQDVALDALVVDLTPENEMGRMNGFMFGGKVFGIAAGMAGTGYQLEYHGFATAMLGMLVLFMIPATAALIIRERAGEKLLPWTIGKAAPDLAAVNDTILPIVRVALRNLIRPQGLATVLVILIYSVHQRINEMTDALFAIRQLGWNQAELGSLMASSNIAMGVLCLTLGGWMVDRFGARRIAVWAGMIALPVMGIYIVDPALWGDDRLYVAWFFVKNVPLYLFYLANLVLMMRATAKEAAALSFALYAAIVPIGFMIGAAMLPLLEDMGGWQAMFGASAAFIFIAGLMALLIANDRFAPGEGIAPGSFKEPTA